MQQAESVSANKIHALILLVLSPVLAAYAVIFSQLCAVPYQDDYDAIFEFELHERLLTTVPARIGYAIAEQHNEYKLILLHAVLLVEDALTHRINLVLLEVVGDLLLLAIGWILWLCCFPEEPSLARRLWRFFPVTIILFCLNYWEFINWPITILQYLPCLMLGLLSLYLVTRPVLRRGMAAWACGCACLSSLASGNGFLLAPIGFVYLLVRRRYALALGWAVTFTLPLAAMLYRYTPASHPAPLHRLHYLFFWIAFLGSAGIKPWASLVLGVTLLALAVMAVRTRFFRTNACLSLLWLWILLTGLLVSAARGASALSFATTSRYQLNCDLMLISAYVMLVGWWDRYTPSTRQQRRVRIGLPALLAVFFAVSFGFGVRGLRGRRAATLAGYRFHLLAPRVNTPMNVTPAYNAVSGAEGIRELDLMNQAVQAGLYQLPDSRTGR